MESIGRNAEEEMSGKQQKTGQFNRPGSRKEPFSPPSSFLHYRYSGFVEGKIHAIECKIRYNGNRFINGELKGANFIAPQHWKNVEFLLLIMNCNNT